MELFFGLFRGIMAFCLSVVCIGGGIAIPIVAVARTSEGVLWVPTVSGVFLVFVGGFLYLRMQAFRPSFRISTSLEGLALELKASPPSPPEERTTVLVLFLRKLFGMVALVCLGVLCIGGGVAVVIVALARGGAETLYIPLVGGILQALFGGYLALFSVGDTPEIKASGDLQGGFSLELRGSDPQAKR